MAVLGLLLALAVFSALLFPEGGTLNLGTALKPPSMAHPFGTDNLGRDLLSRSFNGLRLSLALAVAIQVASLALGTLAGMVAGYFGGILDKAYVLVQNVLQSFPDVVAALCLILLLGRSALALAVAFTTICWVSYARVVRSQVVSLRRHDYIQGAVAVGASHAAILFRHILANALRPVLPLFTLMIGQTILYIAGLSFLGVGVQPPTPEIGLMISDGLTYQGKAPWMFIAPGLVLVVYALFINAAGDGLRELLTPQRGQTSAVGGN
jgi:peptide/nickel transport system permease protein